VLDISLTNISQLITQNQREKGQRVLAFTHKSKVDIAAAEFKKNSIQTHSLHDQIVFDPDRVNTFLHKDAFDDVEMRFALKYYSQYDTKHTILDINTQDDYKIFGALSNQQKNESKKIILCTHQQLFQISHKITDQHTVLFFDKDWRHKNYSKVKKQQFDPLYLLNQLEQIEYKYNLISHSGYEVLQKFHEKTLFLHSTLSLEINQFFK